MDAQAIGAVAVCGMAVGAILVVLVLAWMDVL